MKKHDFGTNFVIFLQHCDQNEEQCITFRGHDDIGDDVHDGNLTETHDCYSIVARYSTTSPGGVRTIRFDSKM